MTSHKNIDEEEFDYNQDEEDKNFCKFKESLDSMVSRRAKKYKNFSHPCLQKSNENLSYDDEMIETFETTKENKSQETMTKEYRVIHRPPLPPSMKNQKTNQSINDYQKRPSDFNYIIDNILSSNSNIKEYLRELRKNSELDYLLLSKILEKTLVQKSNALVQTDYNLFPIKTIRSVETNTNIPFMCQKQTQTRESRILSYKLLETENLFEKLKIQNNFNTNYEIKRTSDLKNEEESNLDEIETKFCIDCNQNHKVKNGNSIKIHDKFMNVNNQDKIQLWNNLLQIDNQSQTSDTSNATSVAKYQQETTSENQSTLSDDDQLSISTRKSKKSLSSIKDDLLFERENDLLERYRRIKDYKVKYEAEKKEFIELRKQFKKLKKKFSDTENNKQQIKKTNEEEYSQKQNEKNLNKENKKITFDEQKNHQNMINNHKCNENLNSSNYETSIDDSDQETVIYDENKDEDQSYLTDSEYSVLDDNKEQLKNEEEKIISNEKIAKLNSELEDSKMNKLLNNNAVKTESKILIETTNLKRKEIAEILSKTELTNSGKISRRTQVTNVKKVPVLMSYENDNVNIHYNTKTPEPIITSPPTTAATTPSATLQRKPKKKHKSNTIEIHSVTPSTSCSTRPTSAIDLDTLNSKPINLNQSNVKFLANSYSEGELNSIKKDKNCLLNEQMNFGISEPFIAYDSNLYNEDDLDKNNYQKYYKTMPNDKGLKLILKKRSPSYNKKVLENSNLQQIIEWQETNSSTITNEINSEPFKNSNDNLQAAKAVTLTTETTLQNNGKERTIETKSKAIRKYNTNEPNDLEKENKKTNLEENNLRSLSRASSNKTNNSKIKNCKNDKKYEKSQETSFNPVLSSSKCNKCDNCSQSEKKKIFLTREKDQNLETKYKNESRKNKDFNDNENSVYVKNVNIDTSYDYLNLYPETLINPLMKYQKYSDPYLDDNYDKKYANKELIESNYGFIDKNKTNLDNISKLSFDSGHSSSMSSTSYQLKIPNQNNQIIEKQNDFIDNVNDDNFVDNKYLSDKYSSDDNINNLSLRPIEDSNFFLPDFHKNNLNRNTEIINRITKTVFPDTIKQKKIKKKKFVFEQQLNSPSNNEEQNDCKISSLITMEIPYYLRKRNKYPKNSLNQFYETSFNPDDDLTTKSSSCSSETDSLINEEDLNTLTKFQKFRPVLINKDDDQTTWEYSLECNCFNGVNASVKTTVTQFHQKNKPTFLDEKE